MAMSSPALAPAALASGAAASITGTPGYIQTQNANQRSVVRVAADQPFRLNLIITADPTVPTNYVGRQISSSAVTVDGATANYTNVAVLEDFSWPAAGRLEIYNSSGVSLNWVADWRLYE